jgi:hypothetical protein
MRNSAVLAIKVALTMCILGAIVWKLDLNTAARTIASVAPAAVAAGLGIAFLQAVCSAMRLSAVVALFDRHLGVRDSLRITLEGSFFAQTFLSFVGGDVFRIFRIRSWGLTLENATAAITLDRLIGTIVNHCVLLATLPWLLATLTSPTVKIALLILAAVGVAGTALVLGLGYLRSRTGITRRLPETFAQNRLVRLLLETATVGRLLIIPRPALAAALLVSLPIVVANSLIFFVLLLGWHVAPITAFYCALCIPAVMEIALLPISIAGWGVREGVVILAFGALGVPSEIAFGSSFAFAIIVMAIGLTGGVLWLFGRRGAQGPAGPQGFREEASRSAFD